MSLVGLRGAVISTHSAHEDGDYFQTLNTFPMSRISTHSAHEDGDSSRFKSRPNSSYFNPLRPRGRRPSSCLHSRGNKTFQPTPPTRTETVCSTFLPSIMVISTHSAHEDGDGFMQLITIPVEDFNPLRPRGRRRYV